MSLTEPARDTDTAGWCSGVGPQPPHYVSTLIGSDPPLCADCWARWRDRNRDEEETL